jgi:release factor glutamine methyltransferase
VFNPTDFISSGLFAEFIKSLGSLKGKHILDMGSGSGVVSVFAASGGAECIAADINPMAIRSIKENSALNGFGDKITAVESDLFEALRKELLFDIIFFNPPYYKGEPKDNFERAFKGGINLEVITRFLDEANNYLKPGGLIYFIVSTDMDIKELHGMFTNAGYKYRTIKEIKKFFETFYIMEIVV